MIKFFRQQQRWRGSSVTPATDNENERAYQENLKKLKKLLEEKNNEEQLRMGASSPQ